MPGRLRARSRDRQRDERAEAGLLVGAGGRAATVRPGVEVRELHAQDAGLELIQPRVVPDQLEGLLVARAVEAQGADGLGERRVRGGDRAAVAEGAEVLG